MVQNLSYKAKIRIIWLSKTVSEDSKNAINKFRGKLQTKKKYFKYIQSPNLFNIKRALKVPWQKNIQSNRKMGKGHEQRIFLKRKKKEIEMPIIIWNQD